MWQIWLVLGFVAFAGGVLGSWCTFLYLDLFKIKLLREENWKLRGKAAQHHFDRLMLPEQARADVSRDSHGTIAN